MEITGAQLVIKALKEEKVDILFAYPGGQAIDLFDALYGERDIQVILPRHEQGLIHAADGYARSTGKVGVCLVTSGPGATNLVTGIATANYDSVPLVCFTGQVSTELIGKHAFQEVDIVSITSSICKYAVSVRSREKLAETIQKAFWIASTGKPGVVVVDLPKDIQRAFGSDVYLNTDAYLRRSKKCDNLLSSGSQKNMTYEDFIVSLKDNKISELREEACFYTGNLNNLADVTSGYIKQLDKAFSKLSHAKKPLFLIGGGVNIAHASKEITELAQRTGIPVVTTIMGKGAISSSHELYIGNIGIHGSYAANLAISRCDVLIAIGTRFNDRITGQIEKFAPAAVIIHIDIDSTCISRNIEADISIVLDAKKAICELIERVKLLEIKERGLKVREWKLEILKWRLEIQKWKEEYTASMLCTQRDSFGVSQNMPQKIMREINEVFTNAVIATDVGQNQLWATQFLELGESKKMITSGGLGTMGYGLPAAIGAKLGNPHKDVIVIAGDGGIQMNIQELATAVVYELPIIICILNNGYLGNVRQWQEMFYERRYFSTCMCYRKSCPVGCNHPDENCPEYTPDFVSLARSYGARGVRVTQEKDIRRALEEAKKNTKTPTVIEFIVDRESNVMPIVPLGNALEDMIMENIEKSI